MKRSWILGLLLPALCLPLLFLAPLCAIPLVEEASSPAFSALPGSQASCGKFPSANSSEATLASMLLNPGQWGINSMGLSLTPLMASGILGNLEVESGFSPKATNGSHFGIAQWDGARWAMLVRSFKDPYLLSSQAAFIFEELSSDFRGAYLSLKAASSSASAAAAFALKYEICPQALFQREEDAKEALSYLSSFSGSECSFSNSPAPSSASNYSWMCSSMGVCKAGEFGEFDWKEKGGYQCYWYWLTREAMLHGKNSIKNPGTPDAGSLGLWAASQKGWTSGSFPRAGGGVSGFGAPLGSGPPFGHVAVVEKVEEGPGGWKIEISGGNFYGNGSWNGYYTQWLTQSQLSSVKDLRFFWKDSWFK